MKAIEILKESLNLECFNLKFKDEQEFDGLKYEAISLVEDGARLFVINVYTPDGDKIGSTRFRPFKDANNLWMSADSTFVRKEYRGLGITRYTYMYARMLGNTIKPSKDQSSMGYGMWQQWFQSGDAEHLTDMNEADEAPIKVSGNERAKAWISKVYDLYPGMWQNNHVMAFGEGDDKVYCVFELSPSFVKKDAVEVKWIQAMPLRGGAGTKGMQELQRLAREDGISLTLFPWDKGQVSQGALTKFYKKQGYKTMQKGGKSMYWSPEIDEAELDPAGWGTTPNSIDIDYFGIQVQMRPSMFLTLAAPLEANAENPEVAAHMEKGGKIAYPFLEFIDPIEWEEGNFSKDAKVRNHEGRNRMKKWIEMKGDNPIPVNIFFKNANRKRFITPEMIKKLSQGAFSETGGWVNGLLFDPNSAV